MGIYLRETESDVEWNEVAQCRVKWHATMKLITITRRFLGQRRKQNKPHIKRDKKFVSALYTFLILLRGKDKGKR